MNAKSFRGLLAEDGCEMTKCQRGVGESWITNGEAGGRAISPGARARPGEPLRGVPPDALAAYPCWYMTPLPPEGCSHLVAAIKAHVPHSTQGCTSSATTFFFVPSGCLTSTNE